MEEGEEQSLLPMGEDVEGEQKVTPILYSIITMKEVKHRCHLSVSKTPIEQSGEFIRGSFPFRLDELSGWHAPASVFDQFKITSIKCSFKPRHKDVTGPTGTVLYSSLDRLSDNPPSHDSLITSVDPYAIKETSYREKHVCIFSLVSGSKKKKHCDVWFSTRVVTPLPYGLRYTVAPLEVGFDVRQVWDLELTYYLWFRRFE